VADKPENSNGSEQPENDGSGIETTPVGNSDSGADHESTADDELIEGELTGLQHALGDAESELEKHREAMLRMQAEMENLRKRLIKDLERSRLRALESFMNDLLPVRDSLERGLETDDDTTTVESMKEGKALIIKMLTKVMENHGLKVIDPAGEPFNPELHQAVSMLESADHEPNTILEVLQKGFQLHDRLVRPAMVVVAK